MQYFLGFDGGGTKTDCVLLDADRSIIGEGRGGPANPLRCGYERAFASLHEAAEGALTAASIRPAQITHLCAGLAGAARKSVVRRVMVFLAREFPVAAARVVTDYEIALEAAVGSGPGVVLIAGTGSVAYGRNAAGETARAGGHGPWIGDEGSAFEIGRRAVSAVARSRDMDAHVTFLADMICGGLGCPDWDDLMLRIMKSPDEVFPRLFPVVVDAAKKGDSAAKEILCRSAIGLANLATAVIRRLNMKDEEFALVKCGGVFGRSEVLDGALEPLLLRAAMRARLSRLQMSPAFGAALMAARLSESSAQTSSHGS